MYVYLHAKLYGMSDFLMKFHNSSHHRWIKSDYLPSSSGRSQNTADARAQHGHTMFASSLVPRPRPAFCHLQYGNAEASRGVWGMFPPKILEHAYIEIREI